MREEGEEEEPFLDIHLHSYLVSLHAFPLSYMVRFRKKFGAYSRVPHTRIF